MNRREKLLVTGVGLLVLLWGSTKGVSKFQLAFEQNEKRLQKVQDELDEARQASERGEIAQKRLKELGRLSLPTKPDLAITRYETWLRDQLDGSGLVLDTLSSDTVSSPHERAQAVEFSVNAKGSLAQLSNFIHGFYQAGHLHRISETILSPKKGEDLLEIKLTIDALSLDICKREDELSDRPSNTELEPLEKYQADIGSRNIFAVYKPLVTEQQPANVQLSLAEDTVAAQAFVTGMTHGQAGWQMSIRMQDSGKIQFYREGDPIEIGTFVGSINKLDGRRAVVTIGNEQLQVRLGQNLSQAQPLADLAG